jgi:methyltransferase (TIGR00027 family)
MGRAKDTAEMTAFARAVGATHRDGELLKNPDHLARLFLGPRFGVLADLCRIGAVRNLLDAFYERRAPGVARYLLARTRHFDRVLEEEIAEGLGQLVLLGAGYDTRPYRYRDALAKSKVFELDHPDTAARKRKMLERIYGGLPEHVVFVAIDFATESLEERLIQSGFDPARRSLFLWEGVSYYLTEQAIDAVLGVIVRRSPPSSAVLFDYIYQAVVDGVSTAYGAPETQARVRAMGEPFLFGLPETGARSFLEARGFRVASDLGPEELDRRYLSGASGDRVGRVSAFFGIAHAKVAG